MGYLVESRDFFGRRALLPERLPHGGGFPPALSRNHLVHRVMETIQELKQRASSLEARGDDARALEVYASIPSEKMEVGLLGRMAAVQMRLGRRDDALRTRERVAGMLVAEGHRNAAIFAYRELLRLAPDHAEAHLRLGQLAGEGGYRRDATAAYSGYLRAAGGGSRELGELLDSLAALPPATRVDVVEALRDEILQRDAGLSHRVEQLMEVRGPAAGELQEIRGLEAGAETEGLLPTSLSSIDPGAEIAPLEGLETGGGDLDEPEITGDLPLIGTESGKEAAADTRARQSPFGLEGSGEAHASEVDVRDEDTGGAETDDGELPLIGTSLEHDQSGVAPEFEPAGAADDEEGWVDFGALVLGDSGAENGTGTGAGELAILRAGSHEDFADLLRDLDARPSEDSEDVGSHYDLGLAYKEMGLLEAAIGQLHDALAVGDNPLASLEVLGECYLERGERAKASAVLQRATRLRTASEVDLLGVQYLLGRCREEMGEMDAARESYSRVIELEPNFRDAAARLERL